MLFKTLFLATMAAVAVAQTATTSASTSTSTSTCAAQNILDACKVTEQGQINACTANDWVCLCAAYGAMATCYNVCPNDPSASSAGQSRDQYCAATKAYGTTTSSVAHAASTTMATSATSAAASGMRSGTSTGSAASSSTANAAVGLEVQSGLLAALFAVGMGIMA